MHIGDGNTFKKKYNEKAFIIYNVAFKSGFPGSQVNKKKILIAVCWLRYFTRNLRFRFERGSYHIFKSNLYFCTMYCTVCGNVSLILIDLQITTGLCFYRQMQSNIFKARNHKALPGFPMWYRDEV